MDAFYPQSQKKSTYLETMAFAQFVAYVGEGWMKFQDWQLKIMEEMFFLTSKSTGGSVLSDAHKT